MADWGPQLLPFQRTIFLDLFKDGVANKLVVLARGLGEDTFLHSLLTLFVSRGWKDKSQKKKKATRS
jgi:hypothetical protein